MVCALIKLLCTWTWCCYWWKENHTWAGGTNTWVGGPQPSLISSEH